MWVLKTPTIIHHCQVKPIHVFPSTNSESLNAVNQGTVQTLLVRTSLFDLRAATLCGSQHWEFRRGNKWNLRTVRWMFTYVVCLWSQAVTSCFITRRRAAFRSETCLSVCLKAKCQASAGFVCISGQATCEKSNARQGRGVLRLVAAWMETETHSYKKTCTRCF